ncbi:MAG: hypothetical protein AB1698_11410 [Pseudomonadota bacterium]
MMAYLNKLASILKSDEGLVSVEYGVILGGVVAVATAVVAGLITVEDSVSSLMGRITTYVDAVTLPAGPTS